MTERREAKRGKETAAGSVELELRELEKLQESDEAEGIRTITVGCGEAFTIVCC